MRLNNIFLSIRWRFVIIYLVIALIILSLFTFFIFSMVESYIVNERINQEISVINKVNVKLPDLIEADDASSLYSVLYDAGVQYGGRWMVLNSSGIVIADSFSLSNGVLIDLDEVYSILINRNSFDYGYYNVSNTINSDYWCVYYSNSVKSSGDTIGVLLFSSGIQDIVSNLSSIRTNIIWIYFLCSAVIIVVGFFLTNIVIKPVKNLSQTANRISNGDFACRAEVHGNSEITEFSKTFNMMCDKIQDFDKQRSEFVSNASHELKTPIATIKILLDTLRYDIENENNKEFIDDIDDELSRMTGLVNDLLFLSKMEVGRQILNIESCSVVNIINECIRSLMPLASSKNIFIINNCYTDFSLNCDKNKIGQALYNLVNNAVKYTLDGGNIEISALEQGGEAFLSVKDNGVGIPESELPNIFDRFYRVNKDRSRETGGSGLGLYIVQRIVLLHNGQITVESEVNKGSVFTIIIPLNITKE